MCQWKVCGSSRKRLVFVFPPWPRHWLYHGTSLEGETGITEGDFRLNLAGSNAGPFWPNHQKMGVKSWGGKKTTVKHDVLISFLGFVLAVQGVSPLALEGVNNFRTWISKWFSLFPDPSFLQKKIEVFWVDFFGHAVASAPPDSKRFQNFLDWRPNFWKETARSIRSTWWKFQWIVWFTKERCMAMVFT